MKTRIGVGYLSRKARLFLLNLLLLSLFLCTPAPSVTAADSNETTVSLMVKLVDGLSTDEQRALIESNGGAEISSIPALRLHVIEAPLSDSSLILENYQRDQRVERVELNKARKAEGFPGDPFYPLQWWLPQIGWESVFGTLQPAGAATVALLDTGVNAAHPDLVGRIIPGTSLLDGSAGLIDPSGHGTALAGIVAALTDNGAGVAAVGYQGVSVMPVTVLDAGGIGWDSDIIAGILWAVEHDADIILMGFSNPEFSQNLQDAIDYAWAQGVVLVAATGNDGISTPTFPAGNRGVVGVAATDRDDRLALTSNYGAAVFLAAPGINIFTTTLDGGYADFNGTSASAGIVAGSAAFMRAVDPTLTNGTIIGRLARTADPAGSQEETGNGRINLARAVEDTSTEEIQPAGATPVGEGGPYVGPYTAAAETTIALTPAAGPNGTVIQVDGSGIRHPMEILFTFGGISIPSTPSPCITSGNVFSCSITAPDFTPGTYTVVATENAAGNPRFGSADFNLLKAGTSVMVTSSADPSTYGQTVTLTAAVTPTLMSSGTPTGTIVFKDGETVLGSITLVAGAANFSTSTFLAGVHGITIEYSGDGNFDASTGSLPLQIVPAPLTVTAESKTKVYGTADQPLTYTYTGLVNDDTVSVFSGGLDRSANENVGSYTISRGTLSAGSNYEIAFSSAILTIEPALLTVTAADASRAFAAANPLFTAGFFGFVNGDTLETSGVTGAPSFTTGADATSPVGTYPIIAAPGSLAAANYTFTFVAGTLTITKASATVTWAEPAAFVYGTALSDAQLNAAANVAGSFTYTPVPGTVLPAGSHTLSAIFTPADTTNYETATASVSTTVLKAPLTVAAEQKTKAYGTADPPLTHSFDGLANGDTAAVFSGSLDREAGENAGSYAIGQGSLSAGSNYVIAFSESVLTITPAAAMVVLNDLEHTYDGSPKSATATTTPPGLSVAVIYGGTAAAAVNAGSYAVVATITDANYAGSATGTLTIAKATPVISWTDPAAIIYSTALGAGQLNAVANMAGSFAYTPAAGTILAAGSHILSVTFTPADSINYETATASIPIIVRKAPLAVTSEAKTKVYGTAVPPLTYSYAGLVNGDTSALFSGSLSRQPGENAGSYPILQATLTAGSNYEITYTGAHLTIEPALLSVTADAASRVYGAANPTFTASYSGFAYGETLQTGGITGFPSLTTTATLSSPLGDYPIVAAQGSLAAANYRFSFVAATLTIVKATPSITWTNPATISYGTALGGEQLNATANVSGNFIYAPAAGTVLAIGPNQPLSVTFTPEDTVNYTSATATVRINVVEKETPVVTWATPADIVYGSPLGGSQLNATVNVPGTFTYTPATGTVLDAGSNQTLSVTFTPNDLVRYEVATATVVINVLKAPLAVTAQTKTKVYGAPEPALTFFWSGLVNGDTAAVFTGNLVRDAGGTVGKYPIRQGTLSAGGNYEITFAGAELTITPALLIVRANNVSRFYGQTNPALTVTYSGFVNGETLPTSGITGAPGLTTSADTASPVGTYPIVAASGSLVAANYTFSFISGTLTIAKVTPTVTWATPADIVYGTALSGAQLNASASVAGSFVYTPTAGTVMNAATGQALSTTFTPADTINYNPVTATARIDVLKAPLSVIAEAKTKVYASPDPSLTYTWSGLVNGDSEAVFTGMLTRAAGENVGHYPISRGSFSAGGNYQITFAAAELSITAASATIILADFEHIYDGLTKSVTASTDPPGLGVTITYNGAKTTPVNAGSYQVIATISDLNYNGSATGTLTIAKAVQMITFPALPDKVYGDAPFAVSATASSALPVSLRASGACTVNGLTITLAGAGSCTVTAEQPGNGNFQLAAPVARSFAIGKATLTVNVGSKSKVYGQTFTAFSGVLNGLAAGDNITATYASEGATASAPVGIYPISAVLNDPGARLHNYNVTINPGTLTIAAASLTVTVQSKSKIYGAAMPLLDAAYAGFAPGEGPSFLTGALACSTTADVSSPVGSYPIICGGQSSANYSIRYIDSSLTVAAAPLTITANQQSRMYGEANPFLDAVYSGFVLGEDVTALAGTLSCTTPATLTSPVANYPITCAGQSAANYSLNYLPGNLTIAKAPLTVTSAPQTKGYGQLFTAFTGTLTGLRAGDSITPVWSSSGAVVTATVGNHPITATFSDPGGRLMNYTVIREEGALTVTPALLTVSIADQTKAYGQNFSAFTGSIAGLQAGDSIIPIYASTGSVPTAAAGVFPITVSWQDIGNRLRNYTLSVATGTLTVTPVPLVITASDKTRLYGSNNPAFGAVYSGLVTGDTAAKLTGNLECTSPANLSSVIGNYPITCGGQSSASYEIRYVAGTLAVTPAPLNVTIENKVKGVGETFTAFTASIVGQKAGDNISASYSSVGSPASAAVGSYPITAALSDPAARLGNYVLSVSEGTLTVLPVYAIAAGAEPGGSISPAGSFLIKEGYTQTFTVTPTAGYQINSVIGCNGTMTENIYTIGPASGDCSVLASFTLSEIMAPTRISVPAASFTGSYSVSWYTSPTPGVDSYVLEESFNGGNYQEIYLGTLRNQSVTGRQDGNYHYRVKALKSGYVDSAWQNSVVCAVVLTCAPPTVINVPATSITGSYQVSWSSVASPTDVTYVLEEKVNEGSFSEIYQGTQRYQNLTGRQDAIYQYRVKAVKSGYVDSPWQNSVICAVVLTCATPTAITVPATSITGTYRVSWSSAASPTGVTYVLEESVNDGGFNEIYRGTQTYLYPEHSNGNYQYRVKAIKTAYADSDWRTSALCEVILTCATPTVITVPATSITGNYQVSWSSAVSPTGVTYVLEESINDSGFSEIYQGTQRYQNLTGRQDGNYQYRVKAVKSGYVESSWQNSVICAVVLTCATPTAINVPATSITGRYLVSWASAVSPTGVTYVLEESVNDGGFSEIYRGTQTYQYPERSNGSYQYRVKAIKTGYADSEWRTSAACTVTLTCAMPNAINVPASSFTGSYQVSWSTAVSPTGVTYVLEESLNDGPWSMVQTGSQNYKSFSGKAAGSYLYRVKAIKSGYLDSEWKTSSACLVTQ